MGGMDVRGGEGVVPCDRSPTESTYVTCDDVKSLSHVKMSPYSVDI